MIWTTCAPPIALLDASPSIPPYLVSRAPRAPWNFQKDERRETRETGVSGEPRSGRASRARDARVWGDRIFTHRGGGRGDV